MSYIEKAIDIAVLGGYETPTNKERERIFSGGFSVFFDPAFWSALGKALGWKGEVTYSIDEHMLHESSLHIDGAWSVPTYQQHRFIDHLASGGTPETFFQDLLANDHTV
jgi:hypothetical protein